jgi:hypothetical protein
LAQLLGIDADLPQSQLRTLLFNLSFMTCPVRGGTTFMRCAGSASTTAGSTKVRWISLSATALMLSLPRNGELDGTRMRSPSRMKCDALSYASMATARSRPARK